MIDTNWDGCVQPNALKDEENKIRHALADAAKKFDWDGTLSILQERRDLINTTRPGGVSLYTPLHQAAYGGAPEKVVEAMLALGAWRTLQNARGERPVDVAERQRKSHLLRILTPVLSRNVPIGILLKIQSHFHGVIRGRAQREVDKYGLRLPELEPLLEVECGRAYFDVPGMYGGFAYQLEDVGVNAKLISESWSRIVGGSGQRHEITSAGSNLVAEGFV